jgi:hypothetical protein
MTVSASLNTFVSGGRSDVHARADGVVSFQVTDPGDGSTSRGHFVGTWTAPVRPLLRWTRDTGVEGS